MWRHSTERGVETPKGKGCGDTQQKVVWRHLKGKGVETHWEGV